MKEMPRWVRLAVTASAPLWAWLLNSVVFAELAGDFEGFVTDPSQLEVSVGAIGIVALFSASGLIELGSLLRAPWREARLAGPTAMAARLRVTVLLAFVLATAQAWGLAKIVSSNGFSPGFTSLAIAGITLVAGFALTLLVASALGRWGLVNGALALVGGGEVVQLVRTLGRSLRDMDEIAWRPPALVVGVTLATALLVWRMSRAGRTVIAPPAASSPPAAPYREADREVVPPLVVEVSPAPAGIVPVMLGATLVTTLVGWGVVAPGSLITHRPPQLLIAGVIAWALGALLVRPPTIAKLWARVEGRPSDGLLPAARSAVSAALARGAFFAFVGAGIGLVVASSGAAGQPAQLPSVVGVAILTAVAIDAVRAFRGRGASAAWASAWAEPRPDAVPAAIAALRRNDIRVHIADATCAWLFPLIGPVAPTQIMVPTADAERAREILAGVLTADPKPTAEPAVALAPILPGGPSRPFTISLVLIGGLVMGLHELATHRVALDGPPLPPATLQLRTIQDDLGGVDPFQGASPPEGGTLQTENVPLGQGRTTPATYLRVVTVRGETLADAAWRTRTWLKQLGLPPDVDVAIGPFEEFDDATGTSAQAGWRTYFLTGAPAVTERDLVDALAVRERDPYATGAGSSVSIELTPEAGERFADVTRKWMRRRIAIVVDDQVMSAPVVQGVITGGHMQITMGAGDPPARFLEAKRLAAALMAGRPAAKK